MREVDAMHGARGEKLPRVLGEMNQDSTSARGTRGAGCPTHAQGEDAIVCQKEERTKRKGSGRRSGGGPVRG